MRSISPKWEPGWRPLPSANPELHKMSTRDAEHYELKVKSEKLKVNIKVR